MKRVKRAAPGPHRPAFPKPRSQPHMPVYRLNLLGHKLLGHRPNKIPKAKDQYNKIVQPANNRKSYLRKQVDRRERIHNGGDQHYLRQKRRTFVRQQRPVEPHEVRQVEKESEQPPQPDRPQTPDAPQVPTGYSPPHHNCIILRLCPRDNRRVAGQPSLVGRALPSS